MHWPSFAAGVLAYFAFALTCGGVIWGMIFFGAENNPCD